MKYTISGITCGIVALIVTILTPCAAVSWAAPPALTTEADLKTDVADRIDSIWESAEIGQFVGAAGARIHYRVVPGSGAAQRGVIVISSGRTESVVKYAELVFDLTRNGYSVFIHDHRGQGLSDRLPEAKDKPELGYVRTFSDYVGDLKTFVDQIVVPRSPNAKRFLLAHSMGGGIAALYLEKYPNGFTAAALSSPMLQLSAEVLGTEIKCAVVTGKEKFDQLQCPRLEAPHYKHVAFKDNPYTHSEVRWARVEKAFEHDPAARLACPSVHWAAEACEAGREARDNGVRLQIPVLVVQAGADTIVENAGQQTFCNNVTSRAGGRCEFLSVGGANHELFIETDAFRGQALTRILQFFGEF